MKMNIIISIFSVTYLLFHLFTILLRVSGGKPERSLVMKKLLMMLSSFCLIMCFVTCKNPAGGEPKKIDAIRKGNGISKSYYNGLTAKGKALYDSISQQKMQELISELKNDKVGIIQKNTTGFQYNISATDPPYMYTDNDHNEYTINFFIIETYNTTDRQSSFQTYCIYFGNDRMIKIANPDVFISLKLHIRTYLCQATKRTGKKIENVIIDALMKNIVCIYSEVPENITSIHID